MTSYLWCIKNAAVYVGTNVVTVALHIIRACVDYYLLFFFVLTIKQKSKLLVVVVFICVGSLFMFS